jgi:hypothetical protein
MCQAMGEDLRPAACSLSAPTTLGSKNSLHVLREALCVFVWFVACRDSKMREMHEGEVTSMRERSMRPPFPFSSVRAFNTSK